MSNSLDRLADINRRANEARRVWFSLQLLCAMPLVLAATVALVAHALGAN